MDPRVIARLAAAAPIIVAPIRKSVCRYRYNPVTRTIEDRFDVPPEPRPGCACGHLAVFGAGQLGAKLEAEHRRATATKFPV